MLSRKVPGILLGVALVVALGAPWARSQTAPATRLAKDGGLLYTVSDLREPGVYRDPAGLFVLRVPSTWRVLRTVENASVFWTFSAEAGRVPPKQIRSGVEFAAVVMSDVFARQKLPATALLKHFLPGSFRDKPGMKLVADVSAHRVGALEGATCTLKGPRESQSGEFTTEVFLAERDGVVYRLACFAPAEEYASLRPTFLGIVADARLGRARLPRREQSVETRQIVQKYRTSVVSIYAANKKFAATGTGFIISRDGYIMTNYHVGYDTHTKLPMDEFVVDWDESLRRPKVTAELVAGRYRLGPYGRSYGTDVALLKIPAGDYEPLPLSSLADVDVGDDVVTLGFPARGTIEGISLTVTKGVVTRFNRGPSGELQSIFIDATIAHGSSGGPCVSLVTGGVIGINSFGFDVELDPRRAAEMNNLIKYHGVVPIDDAIREFPLYCLPGMDPQGASLDFLDTFAVTKYFLSFGSLNAAEKLALRGVALEPQQAIAHMRLGECRYRQALDAQVAGDAQESSALIVAARSAYDQALARDPRQPDTLNAYAQLEVQQDRLGEAATLAARAADADPKDWQGHLLLADIYLRQSRFDDALRQAQKAKDVVGGLIVNPHVTAALIFTAKRDFENAQKEWAEAARISPVYLPARLGVAACYESMGRTDAALAEYNRVLADFSDNGEVLGHIGLCLYHAGRTAESINYLFRSVQRCQAASQPPLEQVLVQLSEWLLQNQRDVDAIPMYCLYLFHYRNGPSAAPSSLRLASIHAQHQSMGLASAHARLGVRLRNTADIAQAAQQFPQAPLSVNEIQIMLQLGYPLDLARELIEDSPLAFSGENDEQFQKLKQQGLPEPIVAAIQESLRKHPPMSSPGFSGGAGAQPGFVPGGTQGGAQPVPAPGAIVVDLRGTWIADGNTPQGPFRCVFIFGDFGLYTSDVFIGQGSLGRVTGNYRFEGGQLILQPQGYAPIAPGFQYQGNQMVMDVPGFAPGLLFVRQVNPGFVPPQ
jgi:tetratricopeptide (TPR) repeat protein